MIAIVLLTHFVECAQHFQHLDEVVVHVFEQLVSDTISASLS